MAQLKDTVVSGSLRATDTIYSKKSQFQILNIPTASDGTTYGPGSNGQILKSNGTSVYWASDNNSDTNVTQTATTTNATYEVLFSATADNTTRTEGARKTSTLTYNPSTKALVTGGTVNGYTLADASAKGVTDNSSNADVTSSDTNLITGRTLYYQLAKKGYTTNTGTITAVQANGTNVATSGTANIPAATNGAYGVTKLTDSYSSTDGTLATTGKALLAAIQTLDSSLPSGSAASKTLTALTITDGKMASATFSDISIGASQVSSGTLGVARGGTGTGTAPTQGGVIYAASASAYASTAAGTTGQFLKSNGAGAPTWNNVTRGDLVPTIKKTYASTSYYATAASNDAAVFYFMSVKPTSWYRPWTVKFKIRSYCP